MVALVKHSLLVTHCLSSSEVGTSCGYSVPFFDYQGERLVLDNFFEKWQEGSDIRPDGVPSKLISYWNKKNGLSIDSMPGLKLADDLSTALVPPFKLESIAQSEKQNPTASETPSSDIRPKVESLPLTLPVLSALLLGSFVLGIIATYGYQAGYYLAAL